MDLYKKLIKHLKNGELILVKTDTVIGIAADAGNTQAIRKMNRIKGAPEDTVRQLLFANLEDAYRFMDIEPKLLKVLNLLLPGPYTFIVKARQPYPFSPLTIHRGKIGVRVPKAPRLLKLIEAYGKPLAATSANLTKKPPVTRLKDVDSAIKRATKGYLPDPSVRLKENQASCIIDITTRHPRVMRRHPSCVRALQLIRAQI